MRIIGGEARGRSIHLPKGCRIRPTSDRVKEALFDILHPLDGGCFLDLFAGCGNVGLEALSRGARRAVFVEKGLILVDVIRKNLQRLGFEGRANIIAAEVETGVGLLRGEKEKFDVLFADPPYDAGFLPPIVKWLESGEILTDKGIVVLQHSVRERLGELHTLSMIVADQRRYGDTVLSFLIKRREESFDEENCGLSRIL